MNLKLLVLFDLTTPNNVTFYQMNMSNKGELSVTAKDVDSQTPKTESININETTKGVKL